MTATDTNKDNLASRQVGIEKCLKWLNDLNNNTSIVHPNISFSPDHIGDGIGVFGSGEGVKIDEVLLTVPATAGLTLQNELFQKSESIQQFIQDCRNRLDKLIASHDVSPFDRYAKVQGRVLLKNYVLLTCVVSLMLENNGDNSQLQQDIAKAKQYYSSFFQTQPHDWSHLPLFWEQEDLRQIEDTSFHALTVRLQKEIQEIYDKVLKPVCKHIAFSTFQHALALVNSHSHSIQEEDMALAAQGLLKLNINDNANKEFVEPIPIIFPIIDLINGMRMQDDCNAELRYNHAAKAYQVVATKPIEQGDEVLLCYGENELSNLDFFVKFGYIPLAKDGAPVLVKTDFVTLPIPNKLRPGKNKVDELRWKELEKHGLGKERIVEPVPYFQRPLYLNGDLQAITKLRTSSAFAGNAPNLPFMDKLELNVMTMLASKTTLKKLAEGKMPPPPVLQPWEPGQRILEILDASLEDHCLTTSTTAEDLQLSDNNYRRVLAAQARMVDRELLLLWRHAIASHHALYRAEAAKVERLPKSNASCCVNCRTSLHVQPCPNGCGAVSYCSDACKEYDWTTGQHSRICALFAAKNKKS